MLKLKSLLSEGFAWERKSGKPLPTLSEVQAEYERNLKEAEDAKPDYRDVDSDGNETESWKKAERDKLKEGSIDNKTVLDLVSSAEDMLQNLRDNMADKKRKPGSVLQREEIDGYLRAYADLLDILSDIGYQAEMGDEEEDDIRGWR
jgi:hypothetical protein